MKCCFFTHVNHVSVSPTNGNGPTEGALLEPRRLLTFCLDSDEYPPRTSIKICLVNSPHFSHSSFLRYLVCFSSDRNSCLLRVLTL